VGEGDGALRKQPVAVFSEQASLRARPRPTCIEATSLGYLFVHFFLDKKTNQKNQDKNNILGVFLLKSKSNKRRR